MYQLTATRKMNPELIGRKYSNGTECKDNTLSIMIDGDNALREIVTGLIHDGYTITIEPGIWYSDELLSKQLEQSRAMPHDMMGIYSGGGSSTPVPSTQTYITNNVEVEPVSETAASAPAEYASGR